MDKIINSLINIIIEKKTFHFSDKEYKFDNQLFEKNILKLEKSKISVVNFKEITPLFLDKYREKKGFEISGDFNESVNFIMSIKDDFKKNGYVRDYNQLEKELWKYLIKLSNSTFKCSFNEYLNAIDTENKPDGIFAFIEAYSTLLSELNITNDIIFENTLILIEITKSNANYNLNQGSVLHGVKNKCKTDYDSGLELLNKSLIVNKDEEVIIYAIVSGLYENKGIEFYNSVLVNIIESGEKLDPIFFGLSRIGTIKDVECDLFVKLVEAYRTNDSLIISILSLVVSILKSDNPKYHSFCFKELNSAIENEATTLYIVSNLDFSPDYSDEKTEIVTKLIKQDYFSFEKYIILVSNVFWHLTEFEAFKKVVLTIIENKPFEKFIKKFHSYIHSVEKIVLDEFVIELLTDNQASKRNAGMDLFNELSIHTPYQFTYNILELPHILQYKLWVSLTLEFHKPKETLTALLPLLNSKSDLIRESFICKLEEISEDYGGHVTNILEENLNKNNLNDQLVIERVRNYIENFYRKNIDLKRSVSELNPYHTHRKSITYFDKLLSKSMGKSIDEDARENSILSIFGTKTVQLAKGGGFKVGNKKEISQLTKFESSFTMPRSYFINPNEYELEKGFFMKKDWTDEEFLETRNFLDNE